MAKIKEKVAKLALNKTIEAANNKLENRKENRLRSEGELQVLNDEAPKGFVFKKTKRISHKTVKRQNIITTIMFLIGFILPTAMAIYKRMNMDQTSSFEQYYFYIFIGLIILDIIIYLPIFFINKSVSRKHNHKKALLFY